MPVPISSGLAAHLAGQATTLAMLVTLVRRDGAELRVTSSDRDIYLGAQRFRAGIGFDASAVDMPGDLAASSISLTGLLRTGVITEDELRGGLWDGATIRCEWVNYRRPEDGTLVRLYGQLGEVRESDTGAFTLEGRGLSQRLGAQLLRVTTPGCQANLGAPLDARIPCGVALAGFTASVTVSAVSDRAGFSVAGGNTTAGFYTYGEARFTSGANAGIAREIVFHDPAETPQLVLFQPFPFNPAPGDALELVAGCDKSAVTCRDKFNNVRRFQGFPNMPGNDRLKQVGGNNV